MNEEQKCQICKKKFDLSELYEYRGFIACEEHFEELEKKVDEKREEVMRVTAASTESQRKGEFINNYNKYNLNNVSHDGLPIIPIREPQILKDYENGIL